MTNSHDHIDHTVMILRDYEIAWRRYEQLGFTLSPPSRHRLTTVQGGPMIPSCTANRCAYFGESYVELIGIVDDTAPDPWHALPLVDDGYAGLRGLSFGLGDSETALHRLRAAGLAGSGILDLKRPVDTAEGTRTVHGRSVHIDRSLTPEGILHTSEHLTPAYVHQPRFLRHANGATRLDLVLLVVEDGELPAYLKRYASLLDRSPDGRGSFQLRIGRVEVVPASAFEAVLPGEAVPVLPYFAAHGVAVSDLAAARALVEAASIGTRSLPGGGFFVSAADACGTAVTFREA